MYKLVNAKGETVTLPAKLKDFRGQMWTITAFTPPHKVSSSGRVLAERRASRGHGAWKQEFFPTVFDLEILEESDNGRH